MIEEHNEDEKVILNEITIRAKIYDDRKPYLQDKSFGFDFFYGDGGINPNTKDRILKQLDARWEEVKAQIVKEYCGEYN